MRFLTRSHTFLEPDLETWHFDVWSFLLRTVFRPPLAFPQTLVLPTRAFFPVTEPEGHKRALEIFGFTKRHAGIANLACHLEPQPSKPEARVGDIIALARPSQDPAGTFGAETGEPLITYDPALVSDSLQLITVFAHELAHLVLAPHTSAIPGGEAAAERATDITAAALGFGLFGANCAFHFERHQDFVSQGWSYKRLGYLDQREWVFALAIFLRLTNTDPKTAKPCLKDHLWSDLKSAIASLEKRPILTEQLKVKELRTS